MSIERPLSIEGFYEFERTDRDTVDYKRKYAFMARTNRGMNFAGGLLLSQIVFYHLPILEGGRQTAPHGLDVEIDGHWWKRTPRDFFWDSLGMTERQFDRQIHRLCHERELVVVGHFAYRGAAIIHTRLKWPNFLEAHLESRMALGMGGVMQVPTGHRRTQWSVAVSTLSATPLEAAPPPPLVHRVNGSTDEITSADPAVAELALELQAEGVQPAAKAIALVRLHSIEDGRQMLEKFRRDLKPTAKKSAAGYLVDMFEQGYGKPTEEEQNKIQAAEEAKKRNAEAARERVAARQEEERRRKQQEDQLRAMWAVMGKEQRDAVDKQLPTFIYRLTQKASPSARDVLVIEGARLKVLADQCGFEPRA